MAFGSQLNQIRCMWVEFALSERKKSFGCDSSGWLLKLFDSQIFKPQRIQNSDTLNINGTVFNVTHISTACSLSIGIYLNLLISCSSFTIQFISWSPFLRLQINAQNQEPQDGSDLEMCSSLRRKKKKIKMRPSA